MEYSNSNWKIKHYNIIIPISIKLQTIKYIENNGNHKAIIAYNVDKSLKRKNI